MLTPDSIQAKHILGNRGKYTDKYETVPALKTAVREQKDKEPVNKSSSDKDMRWEPMAGYI